MRHLLSLLLLLAMALPGRPGTPPRPTFRTLYSDDTTHILSCVSPYRDDGDYRLTDAMIRASVDEVAAAGVEAVMIQPGMTWVPWWQSKVLPLKEQYAWFEKHYGIRPSNPYGTYLLEGGDLVGTFLRKAHARGLTALVSFRLNDIHTLKLADQTPAAHMAMNLCAFYVEHPAWRLNRGHIPGVNRLGQDWLLEPVRDYKFALIREVIEGYPLDGVELDFMRWSSYFPDGTDERTRSRIMAGFIRRVRRALDRRSPGRHLWLSVRLPAHAADWARVGCDPAGWRRAGVDLFNLSNSYCMTQQSAIPALRRAVPDAAVFVELTYTPATWPLVEGNDGHAFRRATDEMLLTTARLARARGADGVSFFNFPYYRRFGRAPEQRGPFDEPPFALLPQLTAAAALDEAPAYYYLWTEDAVLTPGQTCRFTMEMMPPAPGTPGRLRLQVLTPDERVLADGRPDAPPDARGSWEVRLNGHALAQAAPSPASYPFPTRYRTGFGQPGEYLAWELPPGAAVDGPNEVTVTYVAGPPRLRLRWIDAHFPRSAPDPKGVAPR